MIEENRIITELLDLAGEMASDGTVPMKYITKLDELLTRHDIAVGILPDQNEEE